MEGLMDIRFLLLASFSLAALTFAGGSVYARYQGNGTRRDFLPSMIAAGGGYLLAISFLELLPLSIARHRDHIHEIAALVLLGCGAVAASHRLLRRGFLARSRKFKLAKTSSLLRAPRATPSHAACQQHQACCGPILGASVAGAAIGCVVICSFFDGFMVTSGFQAGEKVGLGVLIGQLFHLVPEGIIATSLAIASGHTVDRSKMAALAVGCSFFLGSIFPFLISSQPLWTIPFSLGIALYVTLGQLLPMAMRQPGSWRWLAGGASFYMLVHQFL